MLGFPTLLSDLFVGVRDCLVGFAGDHGRYCSGNLWCRGWESNPERPEARGILRPREEGSEQRTYSIRCPFPVHMVRGVLYSPRVMDPQMDTYFLSYGHVQTNGA